MRDEIEHLMDDDGDMAEMYLTEKKEKMEDYMSNDSDIENAPSAGNKWVSKSAPVSPVAPVSPGAAIVGSQKLQRALSSITGSSRRESFTTSSSSQKEDIVELEMLLEAYFVFIDHTLSKLSSVRPLYFFPFVFHLFYKGSVPRTCALKRIYFSLKTVLVADL